MNTILGFKNLEESELDDHACSPNLRISMSEFHGGLMEVIAIESLEEEGEDMLAIDLENDKPTVWKTIVKVS